MKNEIRGGEVKRKSQLIPRLDTIVRKLDEARRFVRADYACLATNSRFERQVHDAAASAGITVLEGDYWKDLYHGDLEKGMAGMHLNRCNLLPHTIYI